MTQMNISEWRFLVNGRMSQMLMTKLNLIFLMIQEVLEEVLSRPISKKICCFKTTGFTLPGKYSEDKPLFSGSASKIKTTIEYGRSIEYNLSFGYLFYPKKYRNYEPANWNIYLELNGKSYENALVSQGGSNLEVQTDGLTKGHHIEIHSGIQKVISSNLRIDLSTGTNIFNTSYARLYPIFMVSIQSYFYSLKKLK